MIDSWFRELLDRGFILTVVEGIGWNVGNVWRLSNVLALLFFDSCLGLEKESLPN